MKKVIKPDIRNFVNATAHPAGCLANVSAQIDYAEKVCPGSGIKNILVIGSSTGYGLASMITGVFGYGARGLGVCFEKSVGNRRSATFGYYNVAALHQMAGEKGKHIETLNGDAFAHEMRQEVIDILKARYGKVDYIVYSLASSRRQDPDSPDLLYRSCIKPLDAVYTTKSIDLNNGEVVFKEIEPATPEEVSGSVKVMGGEDWKLWIDALKEADLLADGCRTVAYSYIGSSVTARVYRSGTIGEAKKHLEETGLALNKELAGYCGGNAWVCSCQGLVTKASSVIPAIPLYISLLKKGMKGKYESAIGQMTRLFTDHIEPGRMPVLDDEQRIRIDDRELAEDVQAYVVKSWEAVNTENLQDLGDYESFKTEFLQCAGFELPEVNYDEEVETDLDW